MVTMRIITCNVNGIRSAQRKGFFEWVVTQHADFICLQETKAQNDQIMRLDNYHLFQHDAVKPGYSGVAIYAKKPPKSFSHKLGFSCADTEGRFIQLDYPNYSVVSLYLPSGTSGDHRQAEKYAFMEKFEVFLKKHCSTTMVIAGDWNIAHKNIDLKNWRSNQKHSGFLPEERAWLDKVFDEIGWVDAFRVVNQEADQYTWWSNRGRAYEKNVGWRIDYQITSPSLRSKIQRASIYKDTKFSDHAPLIVDYAV